MLNANGVIKTNIPGSLESNDFELMKYEYVTYKEVFADVIIFFVQTNDINVKQNLMLVGIGGIIK